MKLDILFEDNHCIVVRKPARVPVQGDESGDTSLLTMVKQYLKEKYAKPGNVYLGLVHRIDRPVEGIVVFAKTSKAAGRLSEQIRERKFYKEYIAIVEGTLKHETGELVTYLLKDEDERKMYVMDKDTEGAQEARLSYAVIGSDLETSTVHIHLETGRYHQIRAQFSEIGHPLLGDNKYGSHVPFREGVIALWAVRVGFEHPITHDMRIFTLPEWEGKIPPTPSHVLGDVI